MARSSPSSPSLRHLAQEQARATVHGAIVSAAKRLVERVGLRDFKMVELAAEAGVAVGTLYNYFPSREAVLRDLVAEGLAEFHAHLGVPFAAPDPVGRLAELVRRTFGFIDERGAALADLVRLAIEQESPLRTLAREEVRERSRAFRDLLMAELEAGARAGAIRRDLPPAELALALLGLVNITLVFWIESGRGHSLVARTESLLDLFLNGATPR